MPMMWDSRRDERQARKALRKFRKELAQRGLRLNPNKTRVVDARQKGGFDFLGYHFERGRMASQNQ